jgi:hypothetical protein
MCAVILPPSGHRGLSLIVIISAHHPSILSAQDTWRTATNGLLGLRATYYSTNVVCICVEEQGSTGKGLTEFLRSQIMLQSDSASSECISCVEGLLSQYESASSKKVHLTNVESLRTEMTRKGEARQVARWHTMTITVKVHDE